MFPEKILNRNPYKSYILDIMDQKSTLCDEPILNNDDPLKKQRYFFSVSRDFDWFLIYIDEDWVQNDFSIICGSEDMNTLFLADHVTLETYIVLSRYFFRPHF